MLRILLKKNDSRLNYLPEEDKPKDITDTDTITVIKDFEYGFTDPEINLKKLLFLEHEIYTGKNKIIVMSSVNPLGSFVLTKPDDENKNHHEIQERWQNIFNGFVCGCLELQFTKYII